MKKVTRDRKNTRELRKYRRYIEHMFAGKSAYTSECERGIIEEASILFRDEIRKIDKSEHPDLILTLERILKAMQRASLHTSAAIYLKDELELLKWRKTDTEDELERRLQDEIYMSNNK